MHGDGHLGFELELRRTKRIGAVKAVALLERPVGVIGVAALQPLPRDLAVCATKQPQQIRAIATTRRCSNLDFHFATERPVRAVQQAMGSSDRQAEIECGTGKLTRTFRLAHPTMCSPACGRPRTRPFCSSTSIYPGRE